MEQLVQDIRYAIRSIIKRPGFSAAAVLTLALGIGLNSGVLSVVDTVLLQPLPYPEPERLVSLWETQGGPEKDLVTPAAFTFWKEQSQSFESMAAYFHWLPNLSGAEKPETLLAARVSSSLFQLLAIEPLVGRIFTPAEDQGSAQPVAVLSHGLWQRAFGADPDVAGQTVQLDGQSYSILGVMPAAFRFPLHEQMMGQKISLWVPFKIEGGERTNRADHNFDVIARLTPGVPLKQAQAELNSLSARYQSLDPNPEARRGALAVPAKEQLVGHLRPTLALLLAAVACVLLIACANVVNLLMTSAVGRRKEIAIREALGAGRLRVARQFLIESMLLAIAGGLIGFLALRWGAGLLASLGPASIPRLADTAFNLRTAGFALAAALLAGLLSGALVVFSGREGKLHEVLSESGRRTSTAGPASSRMRGLLVVAEVALAVLLTVGAALLIRSTLKLQEVDSGFRAASVLTGWVFLPGYRYSEPQQAAAFYQRLFQRLEGLPGVDAAGGTTSLPLTDSEWVSGVEFESPSRDGENRTTAAFRVVAADYFQALEIPILQGRGFSRSDDAEAAPVAIINQSMAQRFWPQEDPVGKSIKIDAAGSKWWRIAGVVGSTRYKGPAVQPIAEVHVPHSQMPTNHLALTIRSSGGDPNGLVGLLRRELQALDADQAVFSLKAMNELQSEAVSEPRFRTFLLSLFSVLALLLAMLGIYGVLSFAVAQRTHEMGVRMALGADGGRLRRLVVMQGMKPVLIGMGLGLAAALGLVRLISSLLFGVSQYDPWAFAGVTALLLLAALLACYLPARRATRVDPVMAMRE